LRMTCEIVEKLRPFGANPGVGHVAGEEDAVELLPRMDRVKLPQKALESLIAARAQSPALEPESVALPDYMNVGQMSNAPTPRFGRGRLKRRESAGLIHRGIGKAPKQRRSTEIGGHEDNAVGKGGRCDAGPGAQLRDMAEQLGFRPRPEHHD